MTSIAAREVTVRFGGLTAVADATLHVDAGGFTGLIGPNGAGKTTLFNVLSGFQEPTSGRVFIGDHDATSMPASARAKLGVGRTFQKLELFGRMTVYENLLVAVESAMSALDLFSDILGLPKRAREEQRCGELAGAMLRMLDLDWARDRRAADLPVGTARIVELARALCTAPKLLLLDEPSSGLDTEETQRFGELLKRINGEMGIGILLVEHDMDLVMEVCRDIFVLEFGRVIAHGARDAILADPAVRAAYLGEEDDATAPAPAGG